MKKLFIILISLSSFPSTFAFPLVSTEMVTRQKTNFNKTIFTFKNGKTIELNYTFGCVGAEVKHEIQRSANGVLFNTIFEETLLLAECGKTFNFTDNNPIAGINYYRIKLTDPDGRIRFSELASINFITQTDFFRNHLSTSQDGDIL